MCGSALSVHVKIILSHTVLITKKKQQLCLQKIMFLCKKTANTITDALYFHRVNRKRNPVASLVV